MQSYLEQIAKHPKPEGLPQAPTQAPQGSNNSQSAPQGVPGSALFAAQREVQKFKALQERRAQLVGELQNIEAQLNKTQGGLEVFQAMGVLKSSTE
jgi:hypothetical protein